MCRALSQQPANAPEKGTTMATREQTERARDKTLADSFPASDPPSHSGITGAERPEKPSDERNIEEKPTGTPTSDRHATETAHQWEDENKLPPKH
jgi:hypothetical protein